MKLFHAPVSTCSQKVRLVLAEKALDWIDELHPSCGVQTYAIGIRPGLLKRPSAEVDALIDAIPEPGRRATRRSVVDRGVAAPEFGRAYAAHVATFDRAEQDLARESFLAGKSFTLADAAFLPYVLRIDHLNLHSLLEGRPALRDWYERLQARPSYETAVAA